VTLSSLDPGQVNHLALPTSDPARAEKFYREVLGFEQVPRPAFSFDGRWLYRPEVGPMIHLIHDANHQPPSGPINTLGPHFALCCSDIDGAICLLRELDIKFVERVLPEFGYRQIFFRDPDGNLLELGEWPEVAKMVADHRARQRNTADDG
jgi:catechol 2,3-dioxygenase-like lactoylglutathione lyase family enzyme